MITLGSMDVHHARDLPGLRMHLLDGWRAPNGLYYCIARDMNPQINLPGHLWLDPSFDSKCLADAQLWWVSTNMSRLVDRSSKSLPPTTLMPDLLKDPCGLAYFEDPLVGIDTDPMLGIDQAIVHAIAWADNTPALGGPDVLTIATYGRRNWPSQGHEVVPMGAWIPLGRTDWRYGEDTDAAEESLQGDERRKESMAEDRRWMAALQILASEERVADVSDAPISRQIRRRSERAGYSADVRYLDLRAPKRAATKTDGSRSVDWSHRWMVGEDTGGFWRQQPYGPGRRYRRPKWIMPFVKGPEDKPLKLKDTVKILRD